MSSADLPPIYEPDGSKRTPLASAWAFWVQKKGKKFQTSGNWFEGTQCLGRFTTVEGCVQESGRRSAAERAAAESARQDATGGSLPTRHL
jgi:hypothetical protein